MPETKKSKVLKFIAAAGKTGRRFGEIQRFIVEDLRGYDYDLRDEKGRRYYRGWWCNNLTYRNRGILDIYCQKINGRWVHNNNI